MNILAYIEISPNPQSILDHMQAFCANHISLIYILPPIKNSQNDYSVAMSPNGKDKLLEKLSTLDAQKSKIDNQRAGVILDHCVDYLKKEHKIACDTLLKRGHKVSVLTKNAEDHDLIILPKDEDGHIHHALEPIIRHSHKPVLATTAEYNTLSKAVFAFDGSLRSLRAVDFLSKKPITSLKQIDILMVNFEDEDHKKSAIKAQKDLEDVGYLTSLSRRDGKVYEVIKDHAEQHESDLIIAGAYGHSALRHFFVGSTTDAILKHIDSSILLF